MRKSWKPESFVFSDVCRRNWPQKVDPGVIKNAITEFLKHAPQRIKRRMSAGAGRRHFFGVDDLDNAHGSDLNDFSGQESDD